jgi:hypothetical protein
MSKLHKLTTSPYQATQVALLQLTHLRYSVVVMERILHITANSLSATTHQIVQAQVLTICLSQRQQLTQPMYGSNSNSTAQKLSEVCTSHWTNPILRSTSAWRCGLDIHLQTEHYATKCQQPHIQPG